MRHRRAIITMLSVTAMIITGCGMTSASADASGSSTADYGQTKQMVVDILASSEGKQALMNTLKDPSFKSDLLVTPQEIQQAITKSLESKKTQKFLTEGAKDPKFAAALAKAAQPELKTTVQGLMKEPEFQKDMLVLLKSDDFNKNLETLMQGPQFRTALQKLILQSMASPTFQVKFQSAVEKSVQQAMQAGQATGGSSSGSGGGGSSSRSSSGGGSSSS